MMAKRVSDDRTHVTNTASKARLLGCGKAFLTYLDQSTLAVISGIHRITANPAAGGTDVKASVTVKGFFNVSRLLSWKCPSAILANDHFRATAFDTAMSIKGKTAANAYRLFTDDHLRLFGRALDK